MRTDANQKRKEKKNVRCILTCCRAASCCCTARMRRLVGCNFAMENVWLNWLVFSFCFPFLQAHPRTVCRKFGDSLSVREETSWLDVVLTDGDARSCSSVCENLQPRYECLGVCRIPTTGGIQLQQGRVADIAPTACNCTSFRVDWCETEWPTSRGHAEHVLCRCGTPGAATKFPVPIFDAVRDVPTNTAWTDSDASYWADSDGFDIRLIDEPTSAVAAPCQWEGCASWLDEASQFPGYSKVLSTDPRIFYYPNFLSVTEMDHWIEKVCLKLSTVCLPKTSHLCSALHARGREITVQFR